MRILPGVRGKKVQCQKHQGRSEEDNDDEAGGCCEVRKEPEGICR